MEDPPTLPQQQADALALLAEAALHHGLDPGAPGERYQVVVHVDASVLAEPERACHPLVEPGSVSAETFPPGRGSTSTDPGPPGQAVLEDGQRVSAETSWRLACDASLVVMWHGSDGSVLDVGRRTRTISPALRRALLHRDRGCRFPGCGVPFGQGHHLRHWAHGGPTALGNLALLCRRHHRAVHEEGYTIEPGLHGALRFRRPDGRLLPEVPAPATVPMMPVTVLRAWARAEGLHLHPRTACATGSAERLDLVWAIDVLHPLAQAGATVPATESLPTARGLPAIEKDG